MLLPREQQIIELLYFSHKPLTTTELASALQISSRTVKTDIKKIRLELLGTGCEIQTKTGKGIWIYYNADGKKYLNRLLLNEENASIILPETRKYYIALEILKVSGYISMESISERLYVSKGTVMNDVNKLVPFFQIFDLKLTKAVKYGMKIEGSEKQKRIATVNVIRKIVVHQGNEVIEKLQPFFNDIDLLEVGELIRKTESEFSFILSDVSYIDLLLHLSIVITRIRDGHLCGKYEYDNLEYNDCKEWKITNYLREEISKKFDIVLLKGDVDYIYINVIGLKYQDKNVFMHNNVMDIRNIAPERFDGIVAIIKELDAVYGENLYNDISFICSIFLHLNALFARLLNAIYLENQLKKSIKKDLTYEYEIATYLSNLIQRDYYYELRDDDICDIALYVGASIQRQSTDINAFNPMVVIVCGTGMSTSQFVEAKLKTAFPNIVIKAILPLSRAVDEIQVGGQDLVIATVPFSLPDIDILTISPMLSEEDISLVSRGLITKEHVNVHLQTKYQTLLSQLHSNITFFKCSYTTQDEVIKFLGMKLYEKGYVDVGYIKSVIKRETLSSTAIGDGFAIPHSFKGHILKQGVAFMTLRKPILWGNEKVQIILMLSLDPESKDSFKVIFEQLAEITSNYSMIEKIIEADNFEELLKIFDNSMN